ncbi:flagellar biosynthetic protein FliR [Paracoccus cavernae]|uniref:Flagellar biosynthetic protein FliR n=1 Tax=Paracoccus cavernae TaxID=1571207 RepID=A0ABT8D6U5_9RHOB|nr:flagellar biosynthetic protein FliR [Paracoccus cavernae]
MIDLTGAPIVTVIAAALVYCRVQACLLAMPVFAERLMPARLKIALAMGLTPCFCPRCRPPA